MGSEVQTTSGRKYRVLQKISQGAQGIVFRTQCLKTDEIVALKILNKMSVQESGSMITRLQQIEEQGDHLPREFVLPQHIVEHPRVGYVMPFVRRHEPLERLLALRDISRSLVEFSYLKRLQVCYQLASAFRELHTRGMYYADISWTNILVNPKTGSVRIIDNDNLDPTGRASARIIGTPWFIAPELVSRRKSNPDQFTDYHSLATLIYFILVLDHPLIGDHVAQDSQDNEEEWLGKKALFVHHPQDKRNTSSFGGLYKFAHPTIQGLFQDAFVKVLHAPQQRVPNGKWMRGLLDVMDQMVNCPSCNQKALFLDKQNASYCFVCGTNRINRPPLIEFYRDGQTVRKACIPGAKIRGHHWRKGGEFDLGTDSIAGTVMRHETHGLALKNTSNRTIYAQYKGETYSVPPRASIKIRPEMTLNFGPGSLQSCIVWK